MPGACQAVGRFRFFAVLVTIPSSLGKTPVIRRKSLRATILHTQFSMKKLLLLTPFAALMLLASCGKDDDPIVQPPTTSNGTDVASYSAASINRTTDNTSTEAEPSSTTLSGEIISNTVLKTGKTYLLSGKVYVRHGATLKIEPGVTIKGEKSSQGTLIITRNGKIDAQGTASQPIIFTSNENSPTRGDWGGVIILGNARNNNTFNGNASLAEIEGGVNNAAGYGLHGGTNDGDNSGTMKYVRIEYPGIAFQPNSEINGLTMGSVGSGTTIDYVEVYHSGDDAFEWFGGTVNAKHLVAVASTDDDFDTDFGYSGKVQFGISLRDPAQADFAAGGTSNGFECDNDANGSTASPRTSATFSNMTMVGPKANGSPVSQYGRGAHIRRNAAVSIFNSAFIGWPTGLRIDGSATAGNFNSGAAEFKNNFVVNANTGKNVDTAGSINAANAINANDYFNASNTADADLLAAMLGNLALGTAFNATPSGGPLTSGASFTNSSKLTSGFDGVTYRGAVGSTNWTSNWARF